MATTTQRQALPVPTATDDPDIPGDLLALANAIEKRLFAVHTTTAARDAATPSPQDGMFCYITGTNTVYVYQDGAWVSFPGALPTFTTGTAVPNNATGSNGDVYFRV